MKQRWRLRNLVIDKVDRVDTGANQHAHVMLYKSADVVDVWLREFSGEERDRLASEGKALPDGSFPIVTRVDLRNAIAAYGRASNQTAAKRHIIRRARALNAVGDLPDTWDVSKTDHTTDLVTTDKEAHMPTDETDTTGEGTDNGDELARLTTELAAREQELADLAKMTPDELAALIPGLEVAKAADPEVDVAELPEEIQKRLEAADADRERIAKLEEVEAIRKATDRATVEFASLGAPTEIAKTLRAVERRTLTDEDATEIERLLKSANEAVRSAAKQLTQANGTDQALDAHSATGRLETLVKAETDTGTPRHVAIQKVYGDHPELVAEADQERAALAPNGSR